MTWSANVEQRSERVVLAMVAARIGISVQSILITLVLSDSDTTRLWWLLFTGLAIVYSVTGWRYPGLDLKGRRALVLLAFIDIGLTAYEAYTLFGNQLGDDRFLWLNIGTLAIQLVPPLVIAGLVGKSVANVRHSGPSSEIGSFALPDGTVVTLDTDEDY